MKEFGARFWRSLVRRARTFQRDAGRSSSSLEKFQWRALWQLVKRYTCYSVLAVAIGAVVGVVTAVFGHGLLWLNEFRAEHLFWFVPFLGVAGLVIMSVNMHWGGRAQRGMGLVFDVGLGKEGSIPLRMVPLTIFSTWMTHLFGGSAGREGVAVQIGATLSMQFARIAPASLERHIILASGMAAGFAGLFGTPIAATFFALEVMVVGSIYYDALAPALIAAYTASYTARALGLHAMAMPIGPVPDMSGRFMLLTILAGLVFGIVGWGFSWMLNHLQPARDRFSVRLGWPLFRSQRRPFRGGVHWRRHLLVRLARQAHAHSDHAGLRFSGRGTDAALCHRRNPRFLSGAFAGASGGAFCSHGQRRCFWRSHEDDVRAAFYRRRGFRRAGHAVFCAGRYRRFSGQRPLWHLHETEISAWRRTAEITLGKHAKICYYNEWTNKSLGDTVAVNTLLIGKRKIYHE